jgi:hypothetical protein
LELYTTKTSFNWCSKQMLHFWVPFHGAAKLKHILQRPKHMKREGEQRRASSHRGSEAWGHHRGWSQGAVVGAPSWSEGKGHELKLGVSGHSAHRGQRRRLPRLGIMVEGALGSGAWAARSRSWSRSRVVEARPCLSVGNGCFVVTSSIRSMTISS